jgi:MFS family permease
MLPLRFGLAAATAVLLCFTLPSQAVVLAIVVIAIASALGAFWAPAMAMLSDAADAKRLDQGLAAALMNLAWAAGQILGAGAGGAVAKAIGDGVPIAGRGGAVRRDAGGAGVRAADPDGPRARGICRIPASRRPALGIAREAPNCPCVQHARRNA